MASSSGGMGLCSVLLVVFIVLKLVGVIAWSWWLVLTPLWVGIALWIIIIIIALLFTNKIKKHGKSLFDEFDKAVSRG